MRTHVFALVVVAAFTNIANAQHSHGSKGPNGGPLEDIAGVHAELITSSNAVTIHIVDEGGRPISTKGYEGSVLIVTGTNRETVTLKPSGDSALKGEATAPVAPTTVISLVLKTGAGKSGQARFKR